MICFDWPDRKADEELGGQIGDGGALLHCSAVLGYKAQKDRAVVVVHSRNPPAASYHITSYQGKLSTHTPST